MSTPSQKLREDASNLFDLWSTPLSSRPKPTSKPKPKVQELDVKAQRRKEVDDPYGIIPPLLPNPTPTPAQKLEAEELKEKANDLVRQKQYASAIYIYDEAIHLDSTNPFLYGNRALCRLKMKYYLDAASDALDAFKLDPSYIKAHVRYAEATDAMYQVRYSEEGYQTALKLFDKLNLTPAERKVKEEIERSYEASQMRIFELELAIEEGSRANCSAAPPWRRALAVAGRMDIHDPKLAGTSTQILLAAFSHYLKGTESIQHLCRANYRGTMPTHMLARAVMYDNRVWYVWDKSWTGKIRKSILWLNNSQRGWEELVPGQAFREKVLKRLADEGWESMRYSLLFTVHSWIVSAAMAHDIPGATPAIAAQVLGQVVDVITWGRSIWVDAGVPLPQCGILFYPRFLLATRKLHMEALIEAFETEKDKSKKNKVLEDLFNEAETVIEFVDSQPPDLSEEDEYWEDQKCKIVAVKALEEIPCAVAYSVKGLYYKEKAANSQDMAEKAHNAYLKAATLVPDDDELYARYLNAALDIMLTYGAPVKLLLKTADDMREGMRRMYPVWGLGRDNGKSMNYNLVRVNTLKGLRAQGRVKDEDRYCWGNDS
ncbi:hypothetical protein Moror_2625 [Moniliophthora roreri MCA 2997]|uniref:Uncharacterized protein n=1 Tax=Moniliophthora roreri (strain MCA 2997) TaxID=1381753 RepID=V2WX87_MONRO|nr:hypothetical protein Moror_2625 [Moniliophthora roreri MCA 2997]